MAESDESRKRDRLYSTPNNSDDVKIQEMSCCQDFLRWFRAFSHCQRNALIVVELINLSREQG